MKKSPREHAMVLTFAATDLQASANHSNDVSEAALALFWDLKPEIYDWLCARLAAVRSRRDTSTRRRSQ